MSAMSSQITSLTIIYSTLFFSGSDQTKRQSIASLAFVMGKSPVAGEFPAQRASNAKMFPFDDVIIKSLFLYSVYAVHPQTAYIVVITDVHERPLESRI